MVSFSPNSQVIVLFPAIKQIEGERSQRFFLRNLAGFMHPTCVGVHKPKTGINMKRMNPVMIFQPSNDSCMLETSI